MKSTPCKYEAHITILAKQCALCDDPECKFGSFRTESELKAYAEEYESLHFSVIDGWDELGGSSRYFLTFHNDNASIAQFDLAMHVSHLKIEGHKVVRAKIEEVIYDVRYD